MTANHHYHSHLAWTGTTGAGVTRYDREHRLVTPPARAELALSADPAFRGDPDLVNPEQLLLAAASSCQLLSFLAVAACAGIDVRRYEDDAEASMSEAEQPVRIGRIVLRPHIVVSGPAEVDEVRAAVQQAHETCYIANTLNAEMVLEPTIERVP